MNCGRRDRLCMHARTQARSSHARKEGWVFVGVVLSADEGRRFRVFAQTRCERMWMRAVRRILRIARVIVLLLQSNHLRYRRPGFTRTYHRNEVMYTARSLACV